MTLNIARDTVSPRAEVQGSDGGGAAEEDQSGLIGMFVAVEDDASPSCTPRVSPVGGEEARDRMMAPVIAVSPSPVDAAAQRKDAADAAAAQSAALHVPMKHRHQLPLDVIQQAASSQRLIATDTTHDDDDASALYHRVPEPQGYVKSPGLLALAGSSRTTHSPNVGSFREGGTPSPGAATAQQLHPHGASAAAATLTPVVGSVSMPTLQLPQAMPVPLCVGIQRSDVDDALIMQQLLERHRKMRLMASMNKAQQQVGSGPYPSGGGFGSDDDDDLEFVPDAVVSPRSNHNNPPPSDNNSPSLAGGGNLDLQRQLDLARRRRLTHIQDDIFLESLNLTALDDTVDWQHPSTFQLRWWTQSFRRGKVERDFLRYEMHHHRLQPQLIFALTVFAIMLGVSTSMWVYDAGHSVGVVWNVLLGATGAVVAMVAASMRYAAREMTRGDGEGSIGARVSSGGSGGAAGREDDSQKSNRRRIRSAELWSARMAEISAWMLQLTCIWATLSAYPLVTAVCYRTNIFYVPWAKSCVNITEALLSGASSVAPSPFLPSDQRCPEIETYCERAMYPFVVPALLTAIVLFRPRALLAVPTMLCAPFAFAASRSLSSLGSHVDSQEVFWSKMGLIACFSLFGIAVKLTLEREQRRRFRAYAILYHQLSQYVKHREALSDFLDAKLPPLLRSRLLSGNVSLDYSGAATCILFDLAEFPTWCTRMMPLAAATSVMQLHDVISARCVATGVEKIRSLGDVFVGTSNLSVESPDHAALCCQLALQIFSDAYEFRNAFAAPLALRCGMHTGKLIGVVLGATYRRYDIFGDAVATASRVLDVTGGNQIVMTQVCAELAAAYVVTTERALMGAGLNSSRSSRGSDLGGSGSGSPAGAVATEIVSPFTHEVHPLKLLSSLKQLVPPCSAYLSLIQASGNHREATRRQKQQWASSFNRLRDDDAREQSGGDDANGGQTTEDCVGDDMSPSDSRQCSYQMERATFEVLDSNNVNTTTTTKQRRCNLVPMDVAPQRLYDQDELRQYVVLHNSSTKMLERAIGETRMKSECGSLFKRFVSELHELEFSLTYVRAADRVPYVAALLALAVVYAVMVVIVQVEAKRFPADPVGLLNATLRSPSGDGGVGSAETSGAALLAVAAGIALAHAAIVWASPNGVSENSMLMWLLACAMHAFAYFGAATASPSIVGSDATYVFFFSVVVLHFGSWSFSGLVLITIVSLGVFLAATNTTEGTYLPIWTLPLLVVVSVLNMYFDRNRERRLREMYRDLFLTKAAAKAVEGEAMVRRSVLRATLPRPLLPLVSDASNQGRLLTTCVNEAVVAQVRLDSLNEDVIITLASQCESRIRAMRAQHAAATAQLPSVPSPDHHNGPSPTPSSPMLPAGRRASSMDVDELVATALASVEGGPGIIEILLDALVGTELAIVQVFGDVVTIAGPLEETDSRRKQEGTTGDGDGNHADHQGAGQGDAAGGVAVATPEGGGNGQRKRLLEQRVQRAAYDMMLLMAQLFRMQSHHHQLQRNASNASVVTVGDVVGGSRASAPPPAPPLTFSAVCVCDTIINVLANGEYPSYDFLGAGSYFSRVLLQQLPQRGCIATERFVQYYQEEIRLAAAEEGIHVPSTMLGFASRSHDTSGGGAVSVGEESAAAASGPCGAAVRDATPAGDTGALAMEGSLGLRPRSGVVGDVPQGASSSSPLQWIATPPPQPRIGDVERWRVRGLGTLWVYPILPGGAGDGSPLVGSASALL